MKPFVEVKDLNKEIGNKSIISNLSFEIFPGEILGFLGPNGAGKTTTIKIILGLMSATTGQVFINGYNIRNKFENAIQDVGGIIENPELYKYMSGYDNLKHYARLHKGIDKERIFSVIEQMGLLDYINDKVKTYSLGMRQKLGLAQALLHSPKLLVLDEPANGLDPSGMKDLRNHLRNLARIKNTAVFISSHLLTEMELMCDRVIIINNGKFINEQKIFNGKIETGIESNKVYFTVNKIEKAYDIFINLNLDVRTVGKEIEVVTVRDRIPELIAILVKENVFIYEVIAHKKTLEDKFMESIGGE